MECLIILALLLSSLPQLTSLSEDEGSLSLSYNGGMIMTQPVNVALLWFGNGWRESERKALRNAISSLTSDRYPANPGTPTLKRWWEIIRQYKDMLDNPVTDKVSLGAECFYTGPVLNMTLERVIKINRAVFNPSSIDGNNLSCKEAFNIDGNTIYHVLFSHRVMFLVTDEQKELINSCSGNFDELEVSEGKKVKMVWAREPQKVDDRFSWIFDGKDYLGPPNGNEKVDSLIGYALGKIAEEVINRDGRGWRADVNGGELSVTGLCDFLLEERGGAPLFRDTERNVSFNVVGVHGYRYMVHQIWNQKIRNCAIQPSEPCSADTVSLKDPKGYLSMGMSVNHTNGLQPYPPNQNCRWEIEYPSAKFISFTLSYLSITKSNDLLSICNPNNCFKFRSNDENSGKQFKLKGSRTVVEFSARNQVSSQSRGWELSFSAGICDGKEDVYDREGIIGCSPPTGFSYMEELDCQWVLHGKLNTPVSLRFTRINITKDLAYLAIYNVSGSEIYYLLYNFSGLFSESDLPRINLTGKVMIEFVTQTGQGNGWSANFIISEPDNPHKLSILNLIMAVVGVFIGLSLFILAIVLLRKRKKIKNRKMIDDEKPQLLRVEVNEEVHRFGEGPSSIVYRAVLADGHVVAVKSQRVEKPKKDLEEEIVLKTSHYQHIVSAVGYVQDGMRRLLVFEFMSRGSLSLNLREKGGILGWEKRLDIALQVSLALQFLHIYSEPPIYHGNLVSENILLDESWNAKLGGFGSADYCVSDQCCSGKRSEMTEDVLKFGLLLVELLRGEAITREDYLTEIDGIFGGKEFFDQRLADTEEKSHDMGLDKLSEIAKWCIISSCTDEVDISSPRIDAVVLSLKQVKQLFRRMKAGFSAEERRGSETNFG